MRSHPLYSCLLILLPTSACVAQPLHTSPLHLARESPFIAVTVHDCYDGDTCTVTLSDGSLPAVLGEHLPVRLAGIDTPERHSHCAAERELAHAARNFLRERLARATRIDLIFPQRDKYFRLLATLRADGQDLNAALLTAGLARPYAGGTKSPWCTAILTPIKPE
ncbi:MAG TPA: thermonuclease family protein [Nitrospira sp.]|nr:thermonuclease family protein [Nitrospira sp.]